nr:bromodomain-containing protein DDB_G0280777-like [Penaeus vannamei]
MQPWLSGVYSKVANNRSSKEYAMLLPMRQQLIKLDRPATQLVTLLLAPSVQQGQLMTLGTRLQQQQQQQPTPQQRVPTQVVPPQPLMTMVMAEPHRQQLLQLLQPMTLPRLTTHNHQLQPLTLLPTHITKTKLLIQIPVRIQLLRGKLLQWLPQRQAMLEHILELLQLLPQPPTTPLHMQHKLLPPIKVTYMI